MKLAPVYPEENRANILYLTSASFHSDEKKSTLQAGLSYQALQDWVYPLKNVVAVSASWETTWRRAATSSPPTAAVISVRR